MTWSLEHWKDINVNHNGDFKELMTRSSHHLKNHDGNANLESYMFKMSF
jgi:hypothetical protein